MSSWVLGARKPSHEIGSCRVVVVESATGGGHHRRLKTCGLPAVADQASLQRCDNGWVELGPGTFVQLRECILDAQGLTVEPRGGQGVEGVSHRDDPGQQRSVLATQTVRIAAPVHPFVMMQDR